MDIVNSAFSDLPCDWQAENRSAAKVVVLLLDELGKNDIDLTNDSTRVSIGRRIHAKWFRRTALARGIERDVPFEQLSVAEQDKEHQPNGRRAETTPLASLSLIYERSCIPAA